MSDTRTVHPVADLFPMLADDELAELAEDIKQRGLLQPVVLDGEGRVLDGRNRLAACEMADVEPRFETYVGDDPDGYALAVNIARRHLTKGQRAMLMALAGYKNYTEADVSKQYVSWARTVAPYKDLVADVVNGTTPLARAYEVARERDAATADRLAKLARLKSGAPDLADQVDDGRLDLDEALGALEVRERRAQQEEAERQERERRERQIAGRLGALPADLVERVNAGTLGIDEAEMVVKQRAERLSAWAEKIRAGLETFTRMAGNPVPVDLKQHLAENEADMLDAILDALENGDPK